MPSAPAVIAQLTSDTVATVPDSAVSATIRHRNSRIDEHLTL
jgi:hypothetical protein